MESTGFNLFAAGAIVFFLSIGAYVLFVFLLPEWVGITGKVAKESEKSHEGGVADETDFWKKMSAEPIKSEAEKKQSDS